MTPHSGSKTDEFLTFWSSPERVTETADVENFSEVLRVDRFETTDEDESFLLICEVKLSTEDKQDVSVPGQQHRWTASPRRLAILKGWGNFLFKCLRLVLLAMKITNMKKP